MAFAFLEVALIPMSPIVEALVRRLSESHREDFEARAGVMQFETGKERELAEALALLEVIRLNPMAVSGVVLLQATLAGARVRVLAGDPSAAQARLDALGAAGVAREELAIALASLGGAARLTAFRLARQE